MTVNSGERSVAILGTGRMGSAMARRLVEVGWRVTTWSRSGRAVDGATATATARDAVAAAPLVLLSLFDGPACREVLKDAGIGAGTVIVNTSTVGSLEAVDLAQQVRDGGAGYVHAPVIGSVGAARSGRLTVLVGASAPGDVAAAGPLLDALGETLATGDEADTAVLKLIANNGLASALLAVHDGLAQAGAAGIDLARVTALLESGRFAPDDDIAALCLPAERTAGVGDHPAIRLTLAPGVTVGAEVLEPLVAYAAGHATDDPARMRRAFLPTAHVEGMREGAFVSWSLDTYCGLFSGEPAEDESSRSRRIDQVSVSGTVATAKMTLWHGPATFTDIFLLVDTENGWKIANKAYHRH
jgi:3-hydroxyisobutyrate dehydrogenase-like beta-hydroxyacid dehydrogenase